MLFRSTPNAAFLKYRFYVATLVLTGFLPVLLTIAFGVLAYHNARNMSYRTVPLVRRELDKQLTVMVLAQVFVNFFTVLPFAIVNALTLYPELTVDPIIAIKFRFAMAIITLLYYFYFGVSQRIRSRFRSRPATMFRVRFSSTSAHRNVFVDS